MNKNIFTKISFVSFIMSVLVVGIHTGLDDYYVNNSLIDLVCMFIVKFWKDGIARLAVPFFFIKSGAMFFRNYKKELYFTKIKSRLKKLIIPYLAWNTITYMFFLICSLIPAIRNNSSFFSGYNFLSIKNGFMGIFLHTINYLNWFILVLFFLNLISYFLYPLLKKKYLAIIITAICLLAPYDVYSSLNYTEFIHLFSHLGFYLAGAIISMYYQDFLIKSFNKKSSFISLILTIIFCLIYYYYPKSFISNYVLIAGVFSFWIFADMFKYKDNNIFSTSFVIYESQLIIITIIVKLIKIILPNNALFMVVNQFLTVIFVVLICYVINYIINKSKILKKIFLGK